MPEFVLTRKRAGFGSALSYNVMVDDRCIGTIENGATKSFNVASGYHKLHVEVDAEQSFPLRSPMDPAGLRTLDIPMGSHKNYSNSLQVEFRYSERPEFEVRNSGGIAGFFEGAFKASHQGMTLRRL